MMSTATMTVIGGRFIIQVCTRSQPDVTPEFCYSQTDTVLFLGAMSVLKPTKVRVGHQLKTAKAIGIDIALALPSCADEVIE
jgi:hypothetical protein